MNMEAFILCMAILFICIIIVIIPDKKPKKKVTSIRYYACENCNTRMEFTMDSINPKGIWLCPVCHRRDDLPNIQVTERDGLRYYKFKGEDE